jgi:hypothetical protein
MISLGASLVYTSRSFYRLLIVTFGLTFVGTAQAGLGEKRSAQFDLVKLNYKSQIAVQTSNAKPYTVEQLASGSDSILEYHDLSGTCFAVTWTGSSQPDLNPLLAGYAAEHGAALTKQMSQVRGSRAASRVTSENIVVERFGLHGVFHGRAYVPNLIPQGVTLDEIQ